MYKSLQLGVGHRQVYLFNLLERQLARQHETGETNLCKKSGLLHAADVTLSACMQLDGRYVHAQYAHVLNYEGIGAGMIQVGDEPLHVAELAVIYYGVDRGIDFGIELMGKVGDTPDVVYAVGGIFARSVARCAHIHGVGSGKDGTDGRVGITGGCKQLKITHGMMYFNNKCKVSK